MPLPCHLNAKDPRTKRIEWSNTHQRTETKTHELSPVYEITITITPSPGNSLIGEDLGHNLFTNCRLFHLITILIIIIVMVVLVSSPRGVTQTTKIMTEDLQIRCFNSNKAPFRNGEKQENEGGSSFAISGPHIPTQPDVGQADPLNEWTDG